MDEPRKELNQFYLEVFIGEDTKLVMNEHEHNDNDEVDHSATHEHSGSPTNEKVGNPWGILAKKIKASKLSYNKRQ